MSWKHLPEDEIRGRAVAWVQSGETPSAAQCCYIAQAKEQAREAFTEAWHQAALYYTGEHPYGHVLQGEYLGSRLAERFSANIGTPPTLMEAEEWDPRARAFPFTDRRGQRFLNFDPEGCTISLQRGPIKEVGVNGCQIDDVLLVCLGFLLDANMKFGCQENADAIDALQACLVALERRRKNREQREVEGLDKL